MKKFIDKKVLDWKFKKAGEGHSLSEEQKQPSNPGPSKQGYFQTVTPIAGNGKTRLVLLLTLGRVRC